MTKVPVGVGLTLKSSSADENSRIMSWELELTPTDGKPRIFLLAFHSLTAEFRAIALAGNRAQQPKMTLSLHRTSPCCTAGLIVTGQHRDLVCCSYCKRKFSELEDSALSPTLATFVTQIGTEAKFWPDIHSGPELLRTWEDPNSDPLSGLLLGIELEALLHSTFAYVLEEVVEKLGVCA